MRTACVGCGPRRNALRVGASGPGRGVREHDRTRLAGALPAARLQGVRCECGGKQEGRVRAHGSSSLGQGRVAEQTRVGGEATRVSRQVNPLIPSAAWRPRPWEGRRAHGFASPPSGGFARSRMKRHAKLIRGAGRKSFPVRGLPTPPRANRSSRSESGQGEKRKRSVRRPARPSLSPEGNPGKRGKLCLRLPGGAKSSQINTVRPPGGRPLREAVVGDGAAHRQSIEPNGYSVSL